MNLNPKFPVVEGLYRLTEDWLVQLPGKFNQRVEDGSLVLWRPGFTIWVNVYGNDNQKSINKRLNDLIADSSSKRHSNITEKSELVSRYSYRLNENSDDDRTDAFYCFAVSQSGHVMMAIYFDDPNDIIRAEEVWRNISPTPNAG